MVAGRGGLGGIEAPGREEALSDVPYTDAEAAEARQWSNRHGPPNAWTATAGTAARMIGRLLNERERLLLTDAEREAIHYAASAMEHLPWYQQKLRGLLERTSPPATRRQALESKTNKRRH